MKNCQFCNKKISDNAQKCKHCKKWQDGLYKLPYFINMPTWQFYFATILTFNAYEFYWLFISIKNLNALTILKKHNIDINLFWQYIVCIILLAVFSFIISASYIMQQKVFFCFCLSVWLFMLIYSIVVHYIILYAMLNIIEKYALRTTEKKIRHNGLLCFIFGSLYINYAINNYQDRIAKTNC